MTLRPPVAPAARCRLMRTSREGEAESGAEVAMQNGLGIMRREDAGRRGTGLSFGSCRCRMQDNTAVTVVVFIETHRLLLTGSTAAPRVSLLFGGAANRGLLRRNSAFDSCRGDGG